MAEFEERLGWNELGLRPRVKFICSAAGRTLPGQDTLFLHFAQQILTYAHVASIVAVVGMTVVRVCSYLFQDPRVGSPSV